VTEATPSPTAPAPESGAETVAGIELQPDAALIPRPMNITVPPARDNTTFGLVERAALLSRMVAGTEFVPKRLRGRPAAVAAIMLYSNELGIGVMTGLRSIHVTDDGDIMQSAQLMRAMVRREGHKIWPDENPDERTGTRFTWHGVRRDDPDHTYTVTWDIGMARAAGLVRDKSAWVKTPRAMLSARASAELCRLMAEDVLGGMSYALEEADSLPAAQDYIAPEPPPVPPVDGGGPETAPEPRSRSRRLRTEPEAPSPPQAAPAAATSGNEEVRPDGAVAPAPVVTPPPVSGTTSQPGAVSPQTPRPVAPSQQPPVIPVPGDTPSGDGAVGAAPKPEESPPPESGSSPSNEGAGASAGPLTATPRTPTSAQQVAIAAREAGLDRKTLCITVSDRRTDSARELAPEERNRAIEMARGVYRGELEAHRAADGLHYSFEAVPTEAAVTGLTSALRIIFVRDRDAMNTLLEAVDPQWRAKGQVQDFLASVPRATLSELRVKVRHYLHTHEVSDDSQPSEPLPHDPEEDEPA